MNRDELVGKPPEVVHAAMMAEYAKRSCGECQECCYIAEIRELGKPIFKTCEHQCATGCAIHKSKPKECAQFGCDWKYGLTEMKRPDISGVMWWEADGEDGSRSTFEIARWPLSQDALRGLAKDLGWMSKMGRVSWVRWRGERDWQVGIAPTGIPFPDGALLAVMVRPGADAEACGRLARTRFQELSVATLRASGLGRFLSRLGVPK